MGLSVFEKFVMQDQKENNNNPIPLENNGAIPFEKKEVTVVKEEPFSLDKAQKELSLLQDSFAELRNTIELKERPAKAIRTFRVTQSTINPFLVNGGEREAYFKDGYVFVLVGGSEDICTFSTIEDKNEIESFFNNGDKLIFFSIAGYFHVAKKSEYENTQFIKKELSSLYKEESSLETKIWVIESKIRKYNFWKQYNIPFKFVVDIKPVLSGLLENSNGAGANKTTVEHIILQEIFCDGRLKREFNQFLCSQPTGRNMYFQPLAEIDELQEIVTCKQCLAKIEKYRIQLVIELRE